MRALPLLLIVCTVMWFIWQKPEQISKDTLSREYWLKEVSENGPERAYAEFVALPSDRQVHTTAHLLGQQIYEIEGFSGVGICNDAAAFGCYHGFFGRAINAEGKEVISKLNQACRQKYAGRYLPCHHGIGHGILSYVGYDEIQTALEWCEQVSDQLLGGCVSGVFMEYNFRTQDHADDMSVRVFDEGKKFSPCSDLPERFHPACFMEQVQWWEAIYSGDYEHIGKLCYEIKSEESRNSCYFGIGNFSTPSRNFSVSASQEICLSMPSRQGIVHCIGGAAAIFLSNPNLGNNSLAMCEVLLDSEQANCISQVKSNPFYQ